MKDANFLMEKLLEMDSFQTRIYKMENVAAKSSQYVLARLLLPR